MEATLIQMKRLIEKSISISSLSSSIIKRKKLSKKQIIPNEILYKIFSYCDIDTLFHSIPYVSHQWNSLLSKMSFAGQINLKIYDDQQFKKLYSKMKSSSFHKNPYALPNSSCGYGEYCNYGSYGGFSEYNSNNNYNSYSNYHSYNNYEGYGSYNGYNDYGYGYDYHYGNSSSNGYDINQRNKEKEISNDLKPDYKIKLLDSKKINFEISMPIVFQIDLALPLSFISVEQEELNDIKNDTYDFNNNNNSDSLNSINDYSMMSEGDNASSSSSSSSSSSLGQKENNKKELLRSFDIKLIQNYLSEKQKNISQFKAFYYINGIEISIDTDKVITTTTPTPTNNANNETTSSESIGLNNTNTSSEFTEGGSSHSNYRDNSDVTGSLENIQQEGHSSSSSPSSPSSPSVSMEINESNTATTMNTENMTTPTPVQSENVLPNKTMILIELFLEKYKFTPEILKIQNVQWSDKFIHSIPRSVKLLDLKYLGNPDAESIKNGTNYLHSFIRNLSLSSSTILRPRTRRGNYYIRRSTQRTTVVAN